MEGHYTIPDGIETVGKYAFTYCYDITEITMPDSLTTIEDYALASIKVKVQKKKVTTKKLSVKKSITLKKGETYALEVLVTPITTSDRIKYKSADRSIATVSGRGLVTAKAPGRTSITVTCGKKKARISISVI